MRIAVSKPRTARTRSESQSEGVVTRRGRRGGHAHSSELYAQKETQQVELIDRILIAIFKNLTNTSKSETNADNQKE